MHYEVKINEFEGPLDLLLHLIKKSNIDIYDISLVEITNQYLDYINKMEENTKEGRKIYKDWISDLKRLKAIRHIIHCSISLLPFLSASTLIQKVQPSLILSTVLISSG